MEYLGNFITKHLADDGDNNRQCRMFYAQANIISQKISLCFEKVFFFFILKHTVCLYMLHPYGQTRYWSQLWEHWYSCY